MLAASASRMLDGMDMLELQLRSVNVAQPSVLATIDGEEIRSGIAKRPVAGPEIRVLAETLEGDRVADRSVHGGPDKSVYAYSADHWDWWQHEHGLACRPGTFGENLTLTGADETEIRIGDRFAWGEAVLEVSQPRQPCFKFPLHTGMAQSGALMTLSGRCGWYLRVIRQGAAPVAGALTRVHASDGPSVRESFIAVQHRKTSAEARARMAAHPAMAAAFRQALLR